VETIWKKAEPGSIMVVEGTMDKTRTFDLVEKAQAGDRDSYGQLVDRYGAVVLAIAYSRTGNGAIAQDIAQDAFLIGFENISSLRQPARFGAWLRGITTNLCKKWYQSQTYRRRLEEDSDALRERLGMSSPPEPTRNWSG
jgi:DNA-directed RNA polymerase specialized sigma24 family protein